MSIEKFKVTNSKDIRPPAINKVTTCKEQDYWSEVDGI